MILDKKQKKKLVIDQYQDGKTTRQIATELRMSLRYRYHTKGIQQRTRAL
jgi:hypothetical protein